jgi:hypothetical protein
MLNFNSEICPELCEQDQKYTITLTGKFAFPISQCCGSGSAANERYGRIRIRIKVISWIRIKIRINLQMENYTIRALFQGFEPLFGR